MCAVTVQDQTSVALIA